MNATVTPLSKKAKNRLVNSMGNNPLVTIQQIKNGKVFFVSKNGLYCAWTSFEGPDWKITTLNQ